MDFRNLILAGAAVLSLGAPCASADNSDHQQRRLMQIGPDGMPATSEEKAQRERTPRDMAPDTGYRLAHAAVRRKAAAPMHTAPPDNGPPERAAPDMPDTRPGHNGY